MISLATLPSSAGGMALGDQTARMTLSYHQICTSSNVRMSCTVQSKSLTFKHATCRQQCSSFKRFLKIHAVDSMQQRIVRCRSRLLLNQSNSHFLGANSSFVKCLQHEVRLQQVFHRYVGKKINAVSNVEDSKDSGSKAPVSHSDGNDKKESITELDNKQEVLESRDEVAATTFLNDEISASIEEIIASDLKEVIGSKGFQPFSAIEAANKVLPDSESKRTDSEDLDVKASASNNGIDKGEPDDSIIGRQGSKWTRLILPMIRILNGSQLYNWASEQQVLLSTGGTRNRRGPKEKIIDWLTASEAGQENEVLAPAESDLSRISNRLGRFSLALGGTGALLASGLQLADGGPHQQAVLWFSWMAGIVLGSMIGAGQVLDNCAQRNARNVVITGSTRGLGKALAREFLRAGDNVVVASRSEEAVSATVAELQEELALHGQGKEGPLGVVFLRNKDGAPARLVKLAPSGSLESAKWRSQRKVQKVVGMACSVHSSQDVQALAQLAAEELGTVDIWVNNAGSNAGAKPFMDCTPEELEQVVSTNLLGSLICTREAIQLMMRQPRGGHVFNMDGAGSGGSATPKYAAYGATKCGLRQFHASLLEECRKGGVGIHTASPGMVLTDLLLSGATLQNKQVFNIVCEQPETVARALVPRLRTVRGTGKAVNYLTPPRIILALVTAWLRRGRWFDQEGQAVYAAEADRLRVWAEGRNRSSITSVMENIPSGAWLSLFSSSAICAYIMLSSTFNTTPPPGT